MQRLVLICNLGCSRTRGMTSAFAAAAGILPHQIDGCLAIAAAGIRHYEAGAIGAHIHLGAHLHGRAGGGFGSKQSSFDASGTAGDPAGIDVENFACCADLGECRGVGAGHPDLCAELCQFIKQRRAPGGIEMRNHLVEQQ